MTDTTRESILTFRHWWDGALNRDLKDESLTNFETIAFLAWRSAYLLGHDEGPCVVAFNDWWETTGDSVVHSAASKCPSPPTIQARYVCRVAWDAAGGRF